MQLVKNTEALMVCDVSDLVIGSGVCVLLQGQQVALFYLPQTDQKIFALSNWDPIGKANVMSRGIVGSVGEQFVVASPLYKQHFDLQTGCCVEDKEVNVDIYKVTIVNDSVCVEMP
ncbi:MAG: nitrite reductase small subunit NirD [Halioglobus sp.]